MIEEVKLNEIIADYCPSIIKVIPHGDKIWKNVNSRFAKRLNEMDKSIIEFGSYNAETTLYDLINQSWQGNRHARCFLKYIDSIIDYLEGEINPSLHTKFKDIVAGLLQNFDNVKSKYRDRVGELSALARLCENIDWKLVNLEEKIQNGKKIDFVFEDNDSSRVMVEVLNIHMRANQIKTENDLKKFLFGRVEDKIGDKFKNLSSEFVYKITFLPIIWGDFDELKLYSDFFKKFEMEYRILSFCTIIQVPIRGNEYKYLFSNINELIRKYNN